MCCVQRHLCVRARLLYNPRGLFDCPVVFIPNISHHGISARALGSARRVYSHAAPAPTPVAELAALERQPPRETLATAHGASALASPRSLGGGGGGARRVAWRAACLCGLRRLREDGHGRGHAGRAGRGRPEQRVPLRHPRHRPLSGAAATAAAAVSLACTSLPPHRHPLTSTIRTSATTVVVATPTIVTFFSSHPFFHAMAGLQVV